MGKRLFFLAAGGLNCQTLPHGGTQGEESPRNALVQHAAYATAACAFAFFSSSRLTCQGICCNVLPVGTLPESATACATAYSRFPCNPKQPFSNDTAHPYCKIRCGSPQEAVPCKFAPQGRAADGAAAIAKEAYALNQWYAVRDHAIFDLQEYGERLGGNVASGLCLKYNKALENMPKAQKELGLRKKEYQEAKCAKIES